MEFDCTMAEYCKKLKSVIPGILDYFNWLKIRQVSYFNYINWINYELLRFSNFLKVSFFESADTQVMILSPSDDFCHQVMIFITEWKFVTNWNCSDHLLA